MQKLKRVGRILLILYIVLTTMLYFLQEKIIFLPSKLAQDYTYSFSEPFKEFFLTANDGAKLNGLHFKTENPKGVILYFHGNAGDLSRWGEIATFFVAKQYDVVVMDYRTYGKSDGKLSEKALFDDAQLFYDYVLNTYAEEQILVYGRSLGASIASFTASKNTPAKLVLETPFYNLLEIARKRFPVLPVQWLLKYKFESNIYITSVACPITIFHGTQDAVVPFESGKKLYSLATSKKKFVKIDGGGHNDLISFDAYHTHINEALRIK